MGPGRRGPGRAGRNWACGRLVQHPSEDSPQGDDAFTGEQATVVTAIEEAAATRSADDCTRLATGRYLEQREQGAASAALSECTDGVFDRDRGLLDGPIGVAAVDLSGTATATAVIHFEGDVNPGLIAKLELIDGGGGWKLDRITDYVDAERSALDRALRTEIMSARVSFPKPTADCAAQALASLPSPDLEQLLLSGSSQAMYGPVVACNRTGSVGRIVTGLSGQSPGLPDAAAECVRAALTALPDPQLIRILLDVDYDAAVPIVLECDRAAVLSDYRDRLLGPPFSFSPRSVNCVVDRLGALPTAQLHEVLDGKGIQRINERCGVSSRRG